VVRREVDLDVVRLLQTEMYVAPGWEAERDLVMERILRLKLKFSKGYRQALRSSQYILVDKYPQPHWGAEGENRLGRLHMKMRRRLCCQDIAGNCYSDS